MVIEQLIHVIAASQTYFDLVVANFFFSDYATHVCILQICGIHFATERPSTRKKMRFCLSYTPPYANN